MVTWHHSSLLYWVQVDSPAASTMLSRQHLNGQRTLILPSQSRHSFVTPHLRTTYPAHFHLIVQCVWQCPLSLVPSRMSLSGPFYLRFMGSLGSIFLSIALCADLSLHLTHSGFFWFYVFRRQAVPFLPRWPFIPLVSTDLDTGIGYPYTRVHYKKMAVRYCKCTIVTIFNSLENRRSKLSTMCQRSKLRVVFISRVLFYNYISTVIIYSLTYHSRAMARVRDYYHMSD